jgi:nitrite reductase (NADH) small subunit
VHRQCIDVETFAADTEPIAALAVEAWFVVARVADLPVDGGVAVRVGRSQVALFRLSDGSVFAVGNRDPFSGVNVLSRGIVGDRAGEPKVASPIYKQSFSLRTGVCLDDPTESIPTYPARVRGAQVEICCP